MTRTTTSKGKRSRRIHELKKLRLEKFKLENPGFPQHAIPQPRYPLNDSNGLTAAIKDLVNLSGGALFRVNSQGQWDQKLNRWRKSGSDAGIPDLIGMMPGGRFLGVEIKFGSDTQSEKQKAVESRTKASSGLYYIARDFDSFFDWFEHKVSTLKRKEPRHG